MGLADSSILVPYFDVRSVSYSLGPTVAQIAVQDSARVSLLIGNASSTTVTIGLDTDLTAFRGMPLSVSTGPILLSFALYGASITYPWYAISAGLVVDLYVIETAWRPRRAG